MLSILCNVNIGEEKDSSLISSYSNLAEGSHVKNLSSNIKLFNSIISEVINVFKETSDANLRLDRLKKFIGDSSLNEENKFDYVSVAISCLQLFVQVNWLGPVPCDLLNLPSTIQQQHKDLAQDNHVFNLVNYFPLKSQEYEEFQENVRDFLSIDGETVFQVVKCPHLLLIARLIFLDLNERFNDIQFFSWWSLRTIYLYQQLLEERSATLSKMATSFLQTMDNFFSDLANQNGTVKNLSKQAILFASIAYHLEAGHIQYQMYNWTAGQECFRKALKWSELSYEFIGLYGKRTRYQQNDLAQLFLRVETKKTTDDSSKEQQEYFNNLVYSNSDLESKLLPKNVALNDDTVLDKIKLKNKDDEEKLNLDRTISQLEQIVFYCCLFDFQKNNAVHELTLEELSPIIEYLLAHPQNWCVQVCTLFMRAKLEISNSRRMERSLYQIESLLDCYRQPSDQPTLKQRLPFFYSVSYPSFWVLEKQLAKTYMRLGMVNSSLEIYLRLKMWDDVIVCYQALDKRDKAEEVIRQQLAIKETPDLYCSLGEATRNVEHFHKAIELSKGRSARAYRLLAKFCFSKQQYDEAIVNFEKSLEINPMQYDAWFMLGSAAFRTEKWPTSIKAFKSCTNLDPDNYQNWNNLAASYTKLNQKNKAYAVFQEALKYDYENWKIWENFLWTSTDCGYFEDVIKSYHRLLDLKEKYVDIDVLKALSSATRNRLNDANNVPIVKYKQKLLELFGRLTSLVVNDWQVYWYYAETVLALVDGEMDQQTAEKYFGLVQKAFRNLYNQNNWEMSVDKCKEVVKFSTEILKRCNQHGNCLTAPRETFASINMSIKSIMTKLKLKYKVDEENSTPNQVKLLYLKEVNEDFVDIQTEYEVFNKQFFA